MALRGNTLDIHTTLKVVLEECINCGVLFGMADDYQRQLLRSHNSFYCPNGHPQHYSGQSDIERLQAQLSEAQTSIATLRAKEATLLRSRAAVEGELTKLKRRADNGVCIHCHRHFVDVERHVRSKHPEAVAS